ncbi:MAG: hypothetical protein Q7S79_00860 [bacterium]|nr:hypothetical protein [bacterium]
MTKEQDPKLFSVKRHKKFHHSEINGTKAKANEYLTLPFLSNIGSYQITEGWMYSRAEKAIHRGRVHGGIDFHVPYGTVVVAPCNGLAISSYHSFPILEKNGQTKKLKGKQVYFGLGYFIQIYVPQEARFIQLGHLSEIDNSVPFSIPALKKGVWTPTNHTLKQKEMVGSLIVVKVKRGQILGKVGFSGLRWGYNDYEQGSKRPTFLNTVKYQSYDEPHVHFEEMRRDETGKKGWQRDPYDIYLSAGNYPTPRRNRTIGNEPLFIIGDNGLPIFADQI